VGAIDGDVGHVHDVYFDARRWTVRYVVVDTGNWLSKRRVLISPMSFHAAGVIGDRLNTGLTRAQVEQAPSWDTDKPVSRQQEIAHAQHYDYPYYWTGPARWGLGWDPLTGVAPVRPPNPVEEEILARERESADSNLHSANDVMGCYVQAADDDVGHVEDLLVDERTWAIRYLVVDTRNWLPGRNVVIAPSWITSVSWEDSKVHVDLSRSEVEGAPEYDPQRPMGRLLEARLHEHYGRPAYWNEED
jgi:hypothetical protein